MEKERGGRAEAKSPGSEGTEWEEQRKGRKKIRKEMGQSGVAAAVSLHHC